LVDFKQRLEGSGMRHPAAQGRPDANHGDVVSSYEQLFCSVVDLHAVGFGCPDLMIGCSGLTELAEVKTEEGDLLPSQITFQKSWRGSKVVIIRTQEDVIAHVTRMRQKQATGK
jgi:hypothetical protein